MWVLIQNQYLDELLSKSHTIRWKFFNNSEPMMKTGFTMCRFHENIIARLGFIINAIDFYF